jgi:DNA polymerase III alpha subunit (gram-positive type)
MTIQQDHIFLDLETSGLDPDSDEILEIGAIRTDSRGAIYATYTDKVRPSKVVNEDAARVNGYTKERWANAVSLTEALSSMRKTLLDGQDEKVVIVAHFADFDKAFINAAYKGLGQASPFAKRAWICTGQLVWPLVYCGILHSRKLEALCDYFEVENDQPHSATGDVAATMAVYWKMMRRSMTVHKAESAIHGSKYGSILDTVGRIVTGL